MQYTKNKHAYLDNLAATQTKSDSPKLTFSRQTFLFKLFVIGLLCLCFSLQMANQIDGSIGVAADIALADNPDAAKHHSNSQLPFQQESSTYQPQLLVAEEPAQLYRAPAQFGLLRPPI